MEVTLETFTRIYQENQRHHLFSWIETLTQPGINVSEPVGPSKKDFYGFSEAQYVALDRAFKQFYQHKKLSSPLLERVVKAFPNFPDYLEQCSMLFLSDAKTFL